MEHILGGSDSERGALEEPSIVLSVTPQCLLKTGMEIK